MSKDIFGVHPMAVKAFFVLNVMLYSGYFRIFQVVECSVGCVTGIAEFISNSSQLGLSLAKVAVTEAGLHVHCSKEAGHPKKHLSIFQL